MEFSIGFVVLMVSMLVLAILARLAAVSPNSPLLRGELTPALLAVLVAAGLMFGVLMMLVGGEDYFSSRSLEIVVIIGFAAAGMFAIRKFVGNGGSADPA
ncbi:hypothetical protein OEG84_21765 [Hoeflea sp. G2-23]|jgi:hypothetical protein|uniref:Uncharacterized protein n=1 Tax=Hoeflea algicola TaxID=2983763 RepID=A0ABT3ZF53_9HYPH|nr:hypothetical protein [Hoeflea algicola]MCY0150258.1 hypothetical protein [Hoeflea algicola]